MKNILLAFISGSLLWGGLCHFSDNVQAFHPASELSANAVHPHLNAEQPDCCDRMEPARIQNLKNSDSADRQKMGMAFMPAVFVESDQGFRLSHARLAQQNTAKPLSLTGHVIKRE